MLFHLYIFYIFPLFSIPKQTKIQHPWNLNNYIWKRSEWIKDQRFNLNVYSKLWRGIYFLWIFPERWENFVVPKIFLMIDFCDFVNIKWKEIFLSREGMTACADILFSRRIRHLWAWRMWPNDWVLFEKFIPDEIKWSEMIPKWQNCLHLAYLLTRNIFN